MSFAEARIHGEGGEARPDVSSQAPAAWYAVWTRSHCERLVADQLAAKGIAPFLPEMPTPRVRGRATPAGSTPLFPGYLFVREVMDKTCFIEILKARGVVSILERGWTRLTPIPDGEIDAVRRVLDARERVQPHAYLHDGDRVEVVEGPLKGLEGCYVRERSPHGRLVVSVGLLGRGVAVEIEDSAVMPVRSPGRAP